MDDEEAPVITPSVVMSGAKRRAPAPPHALRWGACRLPRLYPRRYFTCSHADVSYPGPRLGV